MRIGNFSLLSCTLFVLFGCANPLNKVTSDRYSQECHEAELKGQMQLAAEACYRAYVNVEWGNLSETDQSEKLYNFGRVLRKSGRYEDAVEALTRSLRVETKLSGPNSKKSGRRKAELAATYLLLNRQNDGVEFVDDLIQIVDEYTPSEKQFIAGILYFYSKFLSDSQVDKSQVYMDKMNELGFSKESFEK